MAKPSGDSGESGHSNAIVPDAGADETLPFASGAVADRRVEDGVQVGADDDRPAEPPSNVGPHVAGVVHIDL